MPPSAKVCENTTFEQTIRNFAKICQFSFFFKTVALKATSESKPIQISITSNKGVSSGEVVCRCSSK